MKAWRRHNAKKEAREHALANSALNNGDTRKWHAHEMKAHRAGKRAMGRHGKSAVNIPMGPPPLADGGIPIMDQENIPPVGLIPDAPPVVVPPSANVPGLPPSLPNNDNFGFPPAPSNNAPIVLPPSNSNNSNNGPIVVPPSGGNTGPIVVPPNGSSSGMPPSWPPSVSNSRPYGNYGSNYSPQATFPMGGPLATQSTRGPSGGIPVLGADQQFGGPPSEGIPMGPPAGAIPVLGGEGSDNDSISIRDGGDKIEVSDSQSGQMPPTFNQQSQDFTVLPSVIMPSPVGLPPPIVMPPPVMMPPPTMIGGPPPMMMPPSVMRSEPMPFVEEIVMRPFPNAGMRMAGEPFVVSEWGGMMDAAVETSYWTEAPMLAGTEVIEEQRTLMPIPPPAVVEETTVAYPPMPVGVTPGMPIPGPTEIVTAGPPMPVGMPPAPIPAPLGRAQLPPRQMNASPIPSGPPDTFTRDFSKGNDNSVIPILPPAPPIGVEQGRESPMMQQKFRGGEGVRGQSPMGDQSHFVPIIDDGNLNAGRNNQIMNMNNASLPPPSNGMPPITGPPGSTPFPTSGSNEFNGFSYLPPKFVDMNGNDVDPNNNMMMGPSMMGNMSPPPMGMQQPYPMQNQNQMFGGMGSSRGGSPADIELRAQTPIGGIPKAPSSRASDSVSRTVSSVGGSLTRDALRDSWSVPNMAVPVVAYRGMTPPPPQPDSMMMSAAYPRGLESNSDSGSVRSARSMRSSGSMNTFGFR